MDDLRNDIDHPGELARRLLKLREDRGWTRAELADRSGISARTIRNIEVGDQINPNDHTKFTLAAALDCSVPDLTGQTPVVLETPEPRVLKASDTVVETETTDNERTTRPAPLYLVLLGLSLVLVFMFQVNQRVAHLRVTDREVSLRGAVFGNAIWSRDFQSDIKVAQRARWQGDDVVVGLSFEGMDGCRLLCLDGATGEERWWGAADPDLSVEAFGPASLEGLRQFGAHKAAWVDLDGDGEDELAVSFMHIRSYPEHIVVFDRHGEVLLEYAHRGHIYTLTTTDPEYDQVEELLVSAVNNVPDFNGGSVFLLDRHTGRSAAVDPITGGRFDSIGDGARARVVTRHWGAPYMSWLKVPRLQSDMVLAMRDEVGRPQFQATVGAGKATVHVLLDAELRPMIARPTDGLVTTARDDWPEGPREPLDEAWLAQWLDTSLVLSRGTVTMGLVLGQR